MVPWETGGEGAVRLEIIENKTAGKGAINSLIGKELELRKTLTGKI